MRKFPFEFYPLPVPVWFDERISYGAKHLLGILLRHSIAGEYKRCSYRWLGEMMKVQGREAMKRMKELVQNGYVSKREPQRIGRVNDYRVNIFMWLPDHIKEQKTTPVQMDTPTLDGHPTPTLDGHPYTREIVQENTIPTHSLRSRFGSTSSSLKRPDNEGDEKQIDLETGEMRETSEKPPTVPRKHYLAFVAYFSARFMVHKGVPYVPSGKDYFRFIAVRKQMSQRDIEGVVEFFLESTKSDKHPTIAACLSAETITLWRMA